eukprot:TRINITY_DN61456_c0_g1_i1.p1 TRINITY_DN61456_c0_g1~~TRINITY_DN61456_c0_g1_i1.p1  ORF type:complete len:541 (-),score=211.03 TRINITY_DN61456_c0_g1_i1:48-1670(-)
MHEQLTSFVDQFLSSDAWWTHLAYTGLDAIHSSTPAVSPLKTLCPVLQEVHAQRESRESQRLHSPVHHKKRLHRRRLSTIKRRLIFDWDSSASRCSSTSASSASSTLSSPTLGPASSCAQSAPMSSVASSCNSSDTEEHDAIPRVQLAHDDENEEAFDDLGRGRRLHMDLRILREQHLLSKLRAPGLAPQQRALQPLRLVLSDSEDEQEEGLGAFSVPRLATPDGMVRRQRRSSFCTSELEGEEEAQQSIDPKATRTEFGTATLSPTATPNTLRRRRNSAVTMDEACKSNASAVFGNLLHSMNEHIAAAELHEQPKFHCLSAYPKPANNSLKAPRVGCCGGGSSAAAQGFLIFNMITMVLSNLPLLVPVLYAWMCGQRVEAALLLMSMMASIMYHTSEMLMSQRTTELMLRFDFFGVHCITIVSTLHMILEHDDVRGHEQVLAVLVPMYALCTFTNWVSEHANYAIVLASGVVATTYAACLNSTREYRNSTELLVAAAIGSFAFVMGQTPADGTINRWRPQFHCLWHLCGCLGTFLTLTS